MIGIDPGYFLDHMSLDEAAEVLKAWNERDDLIRHEKWEQVRKVCFYTVVSMQGTKHYKKPKDLFRFPWEKKARKGKKMSKEEFIERAHKIRSVKIKSDGKKGRI